MSGRKAKAARKAQRPEGEPHTKDPVRNPGRYLTREEREIKRRAEVEISRKMTKLSARIAAAVNKRIDQ